MPVALSLWVDKPYELFDKIDDELSTPQYVTASTVDTWGLDVDAQERMAAFMDMAGPTEWDPTKSFSPSYSLPPEPESAI